MYVIRSDIVSMQVPTSITAGLSDRIVHTLALRGVESDHIGVHNFVVALSPPFISRDVRGLLDIVKAIS